MAFDYINEAFKKLDILEEQMFDTSLKGINELSDFMENDDTNEIIRVVDPNASTEDDIQDSYVGKVIINCNVCHSHIFEDKEEIKIDDDGAVNLETQCPYCGEQEGFTIVGEIAPFNSTSNPEEDTEVSTDDTLTNDTVEEPALEESISYSRATYAAQKFSNALSEDFKEVSITTEDQHMEMTSDENGKVTVTTEPINNLESTEDTIVPVSDETEAEILTNNDVEEPVETETPIDNVETQEEDSADGVDMEIEDVDEGGLDELGESYLKKVYENVKSFKTTSVGANDSALVVEGLITFNSGVKKKTGFIFEAQDVNKRGQLRFRGTNKQLTESKDAFSLIGKLDNKKLFVESLGYSYKVDDKSIRGLVRRK